ARPRCCSMSARPRPMTVSFSSPAASAGRSSRSAIFSLSSAPFLVSIPPPPIGELYGHVPPKMTAPHKNAAVLLQGLGSLIGVRGCFHEKRRLCALCSGGGG